MVGKRVFNTFPDQFYRVAESRILRALAQSRTRSFHEKTPADHIAVAPDHSIWVLQTDGSIYHYAAGVWTGIPGRALQISVGYDGTVYVLGTNAVAGGFGLYKYVGGPSVWQAIPGGALQIVGAGPGEFWAHQ